MTNPHPQPHTVTRGITQQLSQTISSINLSHAYEQLDSDLDSLITASLPRSPSIPQQRATDTSPQLAQFRELVLLQRLALKTLASQLDRFQHGELDRLSLLLKQWDVRFPLTSSVSPAPPLFSEAGIPDSTSSLDRLNPRFQLDPLGPVSPFPASPRSYLSNDSLSLLADLHRDKAKPIVPPLSTDAVGNSPSIHLASDSKPKKVSTPTHHHRHHVNLVPLAGDGGSSHKIETYVSVDKGIDVTDLASPAVNHESMVRPKTSGSELGHFNS
ncbi:hypothetical protein HK096_009483, partial [Nowakowskiella sp. JEL0078]